MARSHVPCTASFLSPNWLRIIQGSVYRSFICPLLIIGRSSLQVSLGSIQVFIFIYFSLEEVTRASHLRDRDIVRSSNFIAELFDAAQNYRLK